MLVSEDEELDDLCYFCVSIEALTIVGNKGDLLSSPEFLSLHLLLQNHLLIKLKLRECAAEMKDE